MVVVQEIMILIAGRHLQRHEEQRHHQHAADQAGQQLVAEVLDHVTDDEDGKRQEVVAGAGHVLTIGDEQGVERHADEHQVEGPGVQ